MSLLPYLYSAFANYHFTGIPPFRALVLDYPEDKNVLKIDDEYMMGENILCAPFTDNFFSRLVYFPKGEWYDFNNNKKYEGGKTYTIQMSLDEIPMFVKANTILPLAMPVEYISPSTQFKISCRTYGSNTSSIQLFEDNSFNFDFEKGKYNWVHVSDSNNKINIRRKGDFDGRLYKINELPEKY